VRERGEQQDGAAVTGRREVPVRADMSIGVSTSEWDTVSQRSESSVLATSSIAAMTSSNKHNPTHAVLCALCADKSHVRFTCNHVFSPLSVP
jgi:hypothetical protein